MPRGRYLCTGRDSPIRCGNCGHTLDINEWPHGETYPDGAKRQRYVCKRVYGGCGSTIADQRTLDGIIDDVMQRWIRQADTIRVIQLAQNRRQAKRRPYVEEIDSLRERLRHWGDLFDGGKISAADHAERVDNLNARLLEAETRLTEVDAIPVPDIDEAGLSDIRDQWEDATDADKRAFLRRAWRGFIVEVDPGSLTDDRRQVRDRVHPPRLILRLIRRPDGN
jgi:hypothetical protein